MLFTIKRGTFDCVLLLSPVCSGAALPDQGRVRLLQQWLLAQGERRPGSLVLATARPRWSSRRLTGHDDFELE